LNRPVIITNQNESDIEINSK